jgi:hypothetical protein
MDPNWQLSTPSNQDEY